MVEQAQKQLGLWVQKWQRAQGALKTVRTEELLNIDHHLQEDLLDEMLTYACQQPRQQESTGLVEQQRIFNQLYSGTTRTPVSGQVSPRDCKQSKEDANLVEGSSDHQYDLSARYQWMDA